MHIFDSELNEYDEIPDKKELCKILAVRKENLTPVSSKIDLTKKYNLISIIKLYKC